MAPRTRLILTAPIAPTLLELAAPNIVVRLIQAIMGAVDAVYLGWLGPDALAGAGQVGRARRVAWTGAAFATLFTGAVGIAVAIEPGLRPRLVTSDPDVLAVGRAYLQVVGPTYIPFGLGLALYFASQGAGRLAWPLVGVVVRLLVAAGGGRLAGHWLGAGANGIFVAIAAGIVAFDVRFGRWGPAE